MFKKQKGYFRISSTAILDTQFFKPAKWRPIEKSLASCLLIGCHF